jgi:Inhibitor of Apoptosis domain
MYNFCTGNKETLSFPNYKDLSVRRESFDTSRWPHTHFLAPARMAKCGLFFTGQGDLVACYNCGIGIHKWEKNDVPEDAHARYSHNCQLA